MSAPKGSVTWPKVFMVLAIPILVLWIVTAIFWPQTAEQIFSGIERMWNTAFSAVRELGGAS